MMTPDSHLNVIIGSTLIDGGEVYQIQLRTASKLMEAAAITRLGLNKMQTNTFFTSSKKIESTKEMLFQLEKEGIKEVKALQSLARKSGNRLQST
eukprot:13553719-Ditylum_brightwellii.AAC.2